MTTAQRLPQLPDTPAISETVPGFAFNAWCAFMVPAKTPPEIVARLNAATHAALNDPAVKKRLIELGFVATPDSPEQLAALPEGGIHPHRKSRPGCEPQKLAQPQEFQHS